jgi:hypothetical protein
MLDRPSAVVRNVPTSTSKDFRPALLQRSASSRRGSEQSVTGMGSHSRLVISNTGRPPPALAADEPDLIFKRSTVFKWFTTNDKLATYGIDDPEVDGVACHFTVPEKGGGLRHLARLPPNRADSLQERSSSRARTSSAPGARCSSRRCRSCATATQSATCSSTWSIPTSS